LPKQPPHDARPSQSRREAKAPGQGMRPSPSGRPLMPARGGSGGRVRAVDETSTSSQEEDDEEGETEVTDSDADADMEGQRNHAEMAGRKNHAPKPRGTPKLGTQRTTPCSRCTRLRRDCHEQVNGIHACYNCGKAKVRCVPGDVGEVARSRKGKGPTRRKGKKAPPSGEPSTKKPSSARRFTRAEKGKSKGEY
jgi:hypothetical protein